MIFYFSGVGNSYWVAARLAMKLGDSLYNIADWEWENICHLKEEERLGFVFPVYGWAPPDVVLQFISILHLSQIPQELYFVCTCGDDICKTSHIFESVVKRRRGWHCCAGYSVTMPNTYVCLPGFDVDSDEVEKKKLQNAEVRVEEIASRIKSGFRGSDCHEGNLPWLKTYVLGAFFRRFLMSPRFFSSTEDCISCGRCVKVCPMHNIRLVNKKPVWGNHCAMCLACYHHCPRHAITYRNRTKGKGQYLPPHFNEQSVTEKW